MKPLKNKYFCIAVTVLLALAIPLGSYAVKNGILPSASSGGYYSNTVNRIDFSVDKTSFSFKKNGTGEETFIATLNLSIRKCETDFYAIIKSVDINGIECNYTLFSANENNGDSYVPENLQIKTGDTLSWQIEIAFNASQTTSLSPELTIGYISGLDCDTADEHTLSVPIQIDIS